MMLFALALFACDAATDHFIDTGIRQHTGEDALETPGMQVLLCGTGTLSGDPDRAGSCVAVIADGRALVFDVGPGSARNLGATGAPLGAVDAVFLTHFHSDHYGDLGELGVATWIAGREEALTVHGPPGVDAVVAGFERAYAVDRLHRAAQHPEWLDVGDAAMTAAVVAPGAERVEVYRAGGTVVEAFAVDHHPVAHALGYRITCGDEVVVISGDTAGTPAVGEHAAGADLLIHEAMDKALALDLADRADETGYARLAGLVRDALPNHSTAADAARAARAAGAERLVLSHISPPLPTRWHERALVRAAEAEFEGEVILARDGMWLTP